MLPKDGRHYFSLEKNIRTHFVLRILYTKFIHSVLQVDVYGNLRELVTNLRRTNEYTEGRDMNRVAFYQMDVAVQSCSRIPTALLGFVLQEDINIHAVACDELG